MNALQWSLLVIVWIMSLVAVGNVAYGEGYADGKRKERRTAERRGAR